MRDLKNEGDWAVGAYLETNNPTLMKLVLVCEGGEEYYLKVKAEHNTCPFESDDAYTEELWLMVDEFWEHYHNLTSDSEKVLRSVFNCGFCSRSPRALPPPAFSSP